ncbi:hypothetical protein AYJ54_06640 [Bradyrhizobium centrolobii]|uniref:MaoC-like domain-containing protein n=1 Tax=Bradyrhizobium centrolobii TaxID=1505087 RepID=A0A176YZX2_9BRAD|nr:hypothetical protein [Bradyrhizobium centrolobii]OAF12317.1 hypothetical protein AYJ54_06640 [Bradyrhizobium centrolobii]
MSTSFAIVPSMEPSHHRTNNVVHDDAEARKLGFKAGLITGTTTYAYLTRPAVAHFGKSWFEQTLNTIKLKAPTFEGEKLTARLVSSSKDACEVELADDDGVRATLSCQKLEKPAKAAVLLSAPLNTARPKLTAELIPAGMVLGTLRDPLAPDECLEYLDQVGDPHAIYREQRIVHPGQLLHLANEVMMNNFTLAPWFHAKSQITNYRPIGMGTPIEVRSKVVEASERNSNKLATIDYVWVLPDDSVAMSARHSIVYERGAK